MAREDVNIKVSADVAEAIRMWRAMEEGPKSMANELEKTGRSGKRAASGMAQEFKGLVGQWASVGAAITAARQLVLKYIESQKEALRLTSDATRPIDLLTAQFANQAGLTKDQADAARVKILQIASDRGSLPGTAFGAAKQLVSSGFSANEVLQGGATDEFLKLLNATNATGANVDVESLGNSLTSFLNATDQPRTAKSINKNSRQIFGLFQGTNLQTADLDRFAKDAAVIKQTTGLDNEQLPIFSQFRDITDTASASTAFRKTATALSGAAAIPKKVQALASIGLTPEQVDFVGEDFFQVQKTLSDAFGAADPTVANIAAKQILGDEALLSRKVLFSPAGVVKTRERLALSGDQAAFDRAVSTTEGSLQAKANAAESAEAAAFFDPDFVDPVIARKRFATHLKQKGKSAFTQSTLLDVFDTRISHGASVELALKEAGLLGQQSVIDQIIAGSSSGDLLGTEQGQQPGQQQALKVDVKVEVQDESFRFEPVHADVRALNTAE